MKEEEEKTHSMHHNQKAHTETASMLTLIVIVLMLFVNDKVELWES